MIVLPFDSKLRLYDVFLHTLTQLSSREKVRVGGGAPQPATGIWKRGAGVAVAHHGNLIIVKVDRFQSSGSESLPG